MAETFTVNAYTPFMDISILEGVNPMARKLRMKIEQRPKKVLKFIAKNFMARYTNDPIFKLVNRWIGATSAFRLGKIIDDIAPQLKQLIIWVGDTGVNIKHDKLKEMWGKGILTGKSYVESQPNWAVDPNGHGTHTLSNCASSWRLAEVISGREVLISMLPGDRIKEIKMCKILQDDGTGSFYWLRDMLLDIKKLEIKDRPHLVNLSVGGAPEFLQSELGEEINTLFGELSNYTLFICSAGNRGWLDPDGESVGFPANTQAPIVVSNMESLTAPNDGSSIGAEVDIASFGTFQLGASGKDNSEYTVKTGTSMSAPAITDVLGILYCCMLKLGMTREIICSQLFPYLRAKQLLFDYGHNGDDAITGEGILIIPDDGRDMSYLYKPN